MTSDSGVVLLAGLIVVLYGVVAFKRAHASRSATGGFGSGLSPAGRESLAMVVLLAGLGLMLAGAIGY